ncbi:TolB family protein [Aliivibrio wodanis]|uniref:TolB family protein n=1 Tax=Aliivibrio wodanis TaxID=80852 RepID=UPI00406C29FA
MRLNHKILITSAFVFLNGCNPQHSTQETTVISAPKTEVELLNEQEWEDNRVYVSKDNYILTKEANGTIPGVMKPCFVVNSAKEWPREDLSNADSYDLPRVDFRWNNGKFVSASASEKAIYESYDKVWSIKTDGTDLRLVTDDFSGDIRIIRRSPNNRYLAYSYGSRTSGGTDKVVFDVQTQKSTLLGTDLGHSQFLWAEDSSYLYFEDRAQYWKYDVTTGKTTQMDDDFHFSEVGVIYGGKRYVVAELGVSVYDEATGRELYGVSVLPIELEKRDYLNINHERKMRYVLKNRSISPDGKYAWGESAQYRYFINTETQEVNSERKDPRKKSQYRFFDVLGLNANYVRSASAGSARQYQLTSEKKLFEQSQHWPQICSGHSATLSWLYNGFANNGAFIKEDK